MADPETIETKRKGWELPKWLWLVFPFALVPFVVYWRTFPTPVYKSVVRSEYGYIENATPVFLILAVIALFASYPRLKLVKPVWLRVAFFLMPIGLLFFAGEEISWGQHFFGWESPEFFEENNWQEETNLHNSLTLGPYLNQIPRILVTAFAFFGGALAPFLWAKKAHAREPESPSGTGWFWPTAVCAPTAILSLIPFLPEKIVQGFGLTEPWWIELYPGEIEEYFFGLFLMLYAFSIYVRLKRVASVEP